MDINFYIIIFAVVFIAFDVLSGFTKALATSSVSSLRMRTGLWHKAGLLLLICVGVAIECAETYGLTLGYEVPAIEFICAYISLMEIVSIVENIGEITPEIKNSKVWDLFHGKDKAQLGESDTQGE